MNKVTEKPRPCPNHLLLGDLVAGDLFYFYSTTVSNICILTNNSPSRSSYGMYEYVRLSDGAYGSSNSRTRVHKVSKGREFHIVVS